MKNNRPAKSPRRTAKFVGCMSCSLYVLWVAGLAVAQTREDPNENAIPPEILDQLRQQAEQRSAHVHSGPEHRCCKPCVPTEADRDVDVFKRPCFVRALAKSRQAFRAYVGLTGGRRDGDAKLTADRIPSDNLDAFCSLLGTVMQPAYLPGRWGDVEFQGLAHYPFKAKTELRNGVPTIVGNEPDLSAELELKDGNGIQTAWTVGGVDVLPLTTYRIPPSRGILIRLRLHGDERLVLRPRPPDFDKPGGRGKFFDRTAFHHFLSNVFQVPFESSADFLVDGFDTEYEGVRVFHGEIRSRDWEHHRRDPNAPRTPPHWWDEMRLLVTDSDPQYFCVQISLGTQDERKRPPEPFLTQAVSWRAC